jgi:hypothetical protein
MLDALLLDATVNRRSPALTNVPRVLTVNSPCGLQYLLKSGREFCSNANQRGFLIAEGGCGLFSRNR